MNVLMVDDEQFFINSMLKRVDWSSHGFSTVYAALNITDGFRILKEHEINLLLCDIELPQGNGLELFEQVKLYYPKTECIFVTCHDDYHYLRRAMQLGSYDYILKPVDYREFDIVLRTAVERIKNGNSDLAIRDVAPRVLQKNNNMENENEYVEKMLYYIRRHIQKPMSITDISNDVHLNSQYAMRLFKKNMNQSILAYITELRIRMAADLLSNTNLSVNSVAASVGFNNTSYFIKLFKKNMGSTPSEYRLSKSSM